MILAAVSQLARLAVHLAVHPQSLEHQRVYVCLIDLVNELFTLYNFFQIEFHIKKIYNQ